LARYVTRDRIRGAMLGCLLGDSFGSLLEGMSRTDSRLAAQIEHRRRTAQPWRYTDDTELMLGLAQSLVDERGFVGDAVMETWCRQYEPSRGYGRGMKLAMRAWARGDEPWTAAWADGSRGTGAAVRVVPIACLLCGDFEQMLTMAYASAALTHRSEVALVGAVNHAYAIATALTLPRLDRAAFSELPATGGNGLTADEAVPLALRVFLEHGPDFESVVVAAAREGGDVDTIAAMAGTLAGALSGEAGLPRLWLENAEGAEPVRELSDQVFALSSSLS
jgi:poly(ADP-ribose) glycohydrolase ARH3